MLEFVAIGPQGSQRWKKELVEEEVVRIGRAPAQGWAVPWDLRISREHCDMVLKGDKLYVRCLETSLNPAYRLGEPVKEFSIGPGEAFRIGQTTFRIDDIETRKTDVNVADDPDVQFELRVVAEQTERAPESDRAGMKRVESIRGRIVEMHDLLEADADSEHAPTGEDQRSKSVQLESLRQQMEALRDEIAAAPKLQHSPPAEQDDSALKALQDEVARLRAKVEAQDAALREQVVAPRQKSADVKQPDSVEEPVDKTATEAPPEPASEDKPKNPIEALKARLKQQAAKQNKRPSSEAE